MSLSITALAITFNEEDNIEKYIESLSFADEIIIIDSYSTDKTVEIAEKLGAKVLQRNFTNFSEQRNYGINIAKNDWILFFDLDEVVSKELEKEIIYTLEKNNGIVAFFVKRNFYFMGKHIKYGGHQSDKVIRVFNKNFCSYNGNLVHEKVYTRGKTSILKTKVEHFSYKNLEHYHNKLNFYSKLKAEMLFEKKVKPNAYHFFIKPLYRFLWQYIYRRGFLDGKEGLILAYIHSFSIFERYLQLWKMYN